ncbi:unnamed protein product [Blepharisma stoltei]|uniref:Uncharacterized protein n=1 Tax=Blepharisma stoltei TaxID=1481888 RepID=A0AAU9JNF1_9CILI|nr:unnamed protein product [Blepharisma stoltei]
MKLIVCAFLLSLAAAIQVVPVPSPSDGFIQGPSRSNYTLEVFIDFLDTRSATAFPAVLSYWSSQKGWLELIIHQFPMSYNLFSFPVSQAGRYIQQNYRTKYMDFVNYWFAHQQSFISSIGTLDFQTANAKIAQLTNAATGVPITGITNALSNQTVNWSTRVSWKYGATRNLPGVPSYLVNGVWVPDAYNFTSVSDWTNFFNSLN